MNMTFRFSHTINMMFKFLENNMSVEYLFSELKIINAITIGTCSVYIVA